MTTSSSNRGRRNAENVGGWRMADGSSVHIDNSLQCALFRLGARLDYSSIHGSGFHAVCRNEDSTADVCSTSEMLSAAAQWSREVTG